MTITAKPLINAKYAAFSSTAEYTVPTATKTIIDKFTVTNTDSGAVTVTIRIVPSGETEGNQHQIIKDLSTAASATTDISSMQNQVLSAGDKVFVVASLANKLVLRMSGREVLT